MQVQSEACNSVAQDIPSSHQDAKHKYAKLTPELKLSFLKKIIFENMTIKQASELLNINYSSAKAILSHHKKSKASGPRKITQKLAAKMTGFHEIGESKKGNGIKSISCSIGGLLVSERQFITTKTKLIQKQRRGEKRQTQDEECQSNESNKLKL